MNYSNMVKRPYGAREYDEHFALKLNLATWLIIAYIMRPFVIYIASISNKTDRFGLLNLTYPDHVSALISGAAAVPTVILLFAWIKRTPSAGTRIRAIWRNGRLLIALSLLINIGSLAVPWRFTASIPNLSIVHITLCCIMLYYLFRSSRVADAFADFPSSNSVSNL